MAQSSRCYTVKVSYFDPLAVFDTVRPEFDARLPLRTLHWKRPNGTLKTITQLPVEFEPSLEPGTDDLLHDKPFIFMIFVSCASMREYRNKVRPLIRQWLPAEGSEDRGLVLPSEYMIMLHSNTEIVDSNLFKTVSVLEKLNKDFPSVRVTELRSVYRNSQEKQEFWAGAVASLKNTLLEIFQRRLEIFQEALEKQELPFLRELVLHENLLKLYLSFNVYEEATAQLEVIKDNVMAASDMQQLPAGELEVPFSFAEDGSNCTLSGLIGENALTKYKLYRYIFKQQRELLTHTSSSTSAYHMYLSIVRGFYSQIKLAFQKSLDLLQFEYYFLEYAIQHELIWKGTSAISKKIHAVLRLQQRDCWLRLVYSNTDYKVASISIPVSGVKYSDHLLKDTFSSESVFYENFLEKTNHLLDSFKECGDSDRRVTDWLSIQLSCLYFQQEKYTQALQILRLHYEDFLDSKWDVIGCHLLELFVKCLLKCPEIEYLETDGEEIPVSSILCNSYLNLLVYSSSSKQLWWGEFLKLSQIDASNLLYPLENLFTVSISRDPYLSKANTYALDVTLENAVVPTDIHMHSAELLLKSPDDDFLTFSCKDQVIKHGLNTLTLETTSVKFTNFTFVSFAITVGDTVFKKIYDSSESNSLCLKELYQEDNFRYSIKQSKMALFSEKKLQIEYSNNTSIEDFSLELKALPIEGELKPNFAFDAEFSLFELRINDFNQREILYYTTSAVDRIRLHSLLTFRKDGMHYSQRQTVEISIQLPLAVSVEDIFKSNAFYFKFMVTPSADMPIALHSSSLIVKEPNGKYSVSENFRPSSWIPLTADPANQYLNYYQIKVREGQKFDPGDLFELYVEYNTLKEELDHFISIHIFKRNELPSTRWEQWSLFWEHTILPQLLYDYAYFNRTRVIKILNEVQLLLGSLSSAISDPEILSRYGRCLELLADGVKFSPDKAGSIVQPNTLIVPVHLPSIKQLFSVRLSATSDEILHVGDAVTIDVEVCNLSTQWVIEKEPMTYIVEFSNSPDWSINGRRRSVITGDRLIFSIQLVSLRRGYLIYPKAEIYTNEKDKVVEVVHINQRDTIFVI
ncbi:AaceriAER352Cp [[Ashbya] aceris (nom. inval.)]|nr:AaceriAER352Cp [[Ashbya] aceris (nom. inval.)]